MSETANFGCDGLYVHADSEVAIQLNTFLHGKTLELLRSSKYAALKTDRIGEIHALCPLECTQAIYGNDVIPE
ncbi:hypothetical protein EMCRGX_G005839 [Ephydatia muelleri]